MKNLGELRTEGTDAATIRGHAVTWAAPYHSEIRSIQNAHCACGAEVQICTNPPANGIDVGGDAVAVGCSKQEKRKADVERKLVQELTTYDRKQSKTKSYNRYALPQYFEAAKGVTDAASFAKHFTPSRGMHGIAKRMGWSDRLTVDRGCWVLDGVKIY